MLIDMTSSPVLCHASPDDRFEASASEHLVSMHLTSLVDFMHSSRRCISMEGVSNSVLTMEDGSIVRSDSVRALLYEATAKLSDLRYPACIEGLLMLVNCLPTDLPYYDVLLPQWMHFWMGSSEVETASGTASSGLTRNTHWDYAWLTLIARARKYCPSSSSLFWRQLLPILFSKTLELMQIPANTGDRNGFIIIIHHYHFHHHHCHHRIFLWIIILTGMEASKPPSGSDFPHGFHAHYSRLLLVQSSGQAADDPRSKAVKKIAKLVHFISVQCDITDDKQPVLVPSVQLGITPPSITSTAFQSASILATQVLPGCVDLLTFLQSLRPFFYPSNSDSWTTSLASFFLTYVLQLCRHVGHALASTLRKDSAPASKRYFTELHLPSVQYLVVHLLPFCMEGIYSKNAHMSSYCSACLKNLLAVHPAAGAPIVLPFLLAALDPEAVSQVAGVCSLLSS